LKILNHKVGKIIISMCSLSVIINLNLEFRSSCQQILNQLVKISKLLCEHLNQGSNLNIWRLMVYEPKYNRNILIWYFQFFNHKIELYSENKPAVHLMFSVARTSVPYIIVISSHALLLSKTLTTEIVCFPIYFTIY